MQNDRNATFSAFGGHQTLIQCYDHWCVLARPKQVTLGSLILLSNSQHTSFADLPADAFTELASVTRDIETALRSFIEPEKMNFLMLMMVDPHVHFHVLPRYSGVREFEGTGFPDVGWPGPPDLGSGVADATIVSSVRDKLATLWPGKR